MSDRMEEKLICPACGGEPGEGYEDWCDLCDNTGFVSPAVAGGYESGRVRIAAGTLVLGAIIFWVSRLFGGELALCGGAFGGAFFGMAVGMLAGAWIGRGEVYEMIGAVIGWWAGVLIGALINR